MSPTLPAYQPASATYGGYKATVTPGGGSTTSKVSKPPMAGRTHYLDEDELPEDETQTVELPDDDVS